MSEPLPPAVLFWIETRLRDALNNDELIRDAAAVLKVGMAQPPSEKRSLDAVRAMICCFIHDALGFDVEQP